MMSIQTNDFNAFQSAIARIYRPNIEYSNQGVVGAGLLISNRYLLTCAHVVASALNVASETSETPTQSIDVDFPLIAPGQKLKAKVVFWKPVQSVTAIPSEQAEDLAILELEGELPQPAQPAIIVPVRSEDLWDHSFRVFGFPSGHDCGIWATGVLRGRQARGWIQIEDVKSPGYQIEPGFSGAPIWDKNLASIVGVAVAAERRREDVKSAFMIPTEELRESIPDNFLSLTDEVISLPIVDECYRPIINAFPDGNIVPLIGAGINLCDRAQGMPIKLALKLTQVYNASGNLLGLPCSVCPLPLTPSWLPPKECPLRQRLETEEKTNDLLTCPLSNEQRLALAKMNLRFLAQYASFQEGDNLYDVLHRYLNETYDELLQLIQELPPKYRLSSSFARVFRSSSQYNVSKKISTTPLPTDCNN